MVPIITIVFVGMDKISLDPYVIDVLMPDLIGHDHRPAAFLVYLFLLRQSVGGRGDTVAVSLQGIASKTGLSKSTVQTALRHLKSRGLLDGTVNATVRDPKRRVLKPWTRRA